MKFSKSTFILVLTFLALLVLQCATPTQPTGGPADRTPPSIISTLPENETVNFSDKELRFNFDKYVDRNSFNQSFRIDPDFDLTYNIRFSGRSARVIFDETLPDSTTIIFTLGTELSDNNRNRITAPFQLAISTGDRIDKGSVTGKVRDGDTGEGLQDAFVFLYQEPVDFSKPARFVAETDTSGAFKFWYLPATFYRAIWVDDRNRNRIWDSSTEAARPFQTKSFDLEEDGEFDLGTIFISEPDTIKPRLQGVGMLSSNRLRLRFSKNMVINHEKSSISVHEAESKAVASSAIPLFVDKQQPNVILAHSMEALSPETFYYLSFDTLTDKAGNQIELQQLEFEGSGVADTTHVRIHKHKTQSGVLQNEPHRFLLTGITSNSVLMDSLQIIQDEIIYTDWAGKSIKNNIITISPIDEWETGSTYTARFFDERSGRWETYELNFFPTSRLGGLSIKIDEDHIEDGVNHIIEIINMDGELMRSVSIESEYEFDDLPSSRYTIRAFKDIDGSGRYNPGNIKPFDAPEPKFIQRNVQVPERMTGEVIVRYPL